MFDLFWFVPLHQVGREQYSLGSLKQIVTTTPSAYRVGSCEGIYLRQEDDNWLSARAKLVQRDFVQSMGEQWSSRSPFWNLLNPTGGFTVISDQAGRRFSSEFSERF
jgi:hypothetical protein